MNKKILLFQKYETISANEGTVFSDFSSNDNTGNLEKSNQTLSMMITLIRKIITKKLLL